MIVNNLTEQAALEGFGNGIDCSMAVFGEIGPQLGLDKDTCLKLTAAFGDGMWRGDTCGCVVGSLMALGMKYEKPVLEEKKAEFEKRFAEQFGGLKCREMLGYDVGKGELPQIMEAGCFEKVCCKAAKSACDILADIMND